ncbi:MAG: hypothetical protein K8R88_06620 [Armatimonadetes bacterium]|nr:hypothetical protein [Armatimonadota bacterium]
MPIILAALLLQPKAEPPLAILQMALLPLQARSATVSFTTSDRLIGRWAF